MRDEFHERAIQLIDKGQVEGLTAEERNWLEAHVESCAPCEKQAHDTERAVRALRSAIRNELEQHDNTAQQGLGTRQLKSF